MRFKKSPSRKHKATTTAIVPLGNANLIGREELQHARDAVTSAQAQLDVAIQQYNANQAMILGTKLEDQPAVQQAATGST